MYIHSGAGLMKVGTGEKGTSPGVVYSFIKNYRNKEPSQLFCIGDKLYLRSSQSKTEFLVVLSTEFLTEIGTLNLDGTGSLPSKNLASLIGKAEESDDAPAEENDEDADDTAGPAASGSGDMEQAFREMVLEDLGPPPDDYDEMQDYQEEVESMRAEFAMRWEESQGNMAALRPNRMALLSESEDGEGSLAAGGAAYAPPSSAYTPRSGKVEQELLVPGPNHLVMLKKARKKAEEISQQAGDEAAAVAAASEASPIGFNAYVVAPQSELKLLKTIPLCRP